MDPVTAAIVTIASTVVAAGAGTYGAIAQRRQANYQASAMSANAQAQRYNAQWQQQQADYQAQVQQIHDKQLYGAQRAAIGASGVDLSGSALDLLSQSSSQNAQQEENIRRSGQFQVQNTLFQAGSLNTQSSAATQAGQSAYYGGLFSSGSTLLTGVGSASNAYQYNTAYKSYTANKAAAQVNSAYSTNPGYPMFGP